MTLAASSANTTTHSTSSHRFAGPDTCLAPLQPGQSCELGIIFAPSTTGVTTNTSVLVYPLGHQADATLSDSANLVGNGVTM